MKKTVFVGLAIIALIVGSYFIWSKTQSKLPDYIASGNGRIETDVIYVATTKGGRVESVLIEEGRKVKKGQVIGYMDITTLEADFEHAKANVLRVEASVAEADAQIIEKESAFDFAETSLQRVLPLAESGTISQSELDGRQADRDKAKAMLDHALAQRESLDHEIKVAEAKVNQIQTLIDESEITAPVAGRIQHKLAEPGEVLAPGGKIIALLDMEDVYMTIFLPTYQVGKVQLDAEARIIMDAFPNYVIPAKVSFVASDAQFTPREVETRTEREKLMFRVKVRVPKKDLKNYDDKVRSGMPGVAYVLLDAGKKWPRRLKVKGAG